MTHRVVHRTTQSNRNIGLLPSGDFPARISSTTFFKEWSSTPTIWNPWSRRKLSLLWRRKSARTNCSTNYYQSETEQYLILLESMRRFPLRAARSMAASASLCLFAKSRLQHLRPPGRAHSFEYQNRDRLDALHPNPAREASNRVAFRFSHGDEKYAQYFINCDCYRVFLLKLNKFVKKTGFCR